MSAAVSAVGLGSAGGSGVEWEMETVEAVLAATEKLAATENRHAARPHKTRGTSTAAVQAPRAC